MKRTKQNIIYHIFTLIIGIIMIYPLLWMLSSSFKENADIFTTIGQLIPPKFTLENYKEGWKGFGNVTFSTFLGIPL